MLLNKKTFLVYNTRAEFFNSALFFRVLFVVVIFCEQMFGIALLVLNASSGAVCGSNLY